jgi:hypothetical protein
MKMASINKMYVKTYKGIHVHMVVSIIMITDKKQQQLLSYNVDIIENVWSMHVINHQI